MKFPVIRESYFLNIVILLFSLFVSWFTLLFGIAHLIEAIGSEPNPKMLLVESIKGWIIVIGLCVVGFIFLVIAIASIKGILYKYKKLDK